MRLIPLFCLALSLAGCATTTGIVPVGPDTYLVSEMRVPAVGGGPEAQRAVLAEATAFCAARGRVFAPITMRPDGDPTTPYYPTAYDATFQCEPPAPAAQGTPSR
jgi:hypothetical protein